MKLRPKPKPKRPPVAAGSSKTKNVAPHLCNLLYTIPLNENKTLTYEIF